MLSFCSDSSSNALYRSELECLKLWSICASYGYLHPEFRYGCTRDILDARVIIWQGRVLHLPLLAVCRNLLRSFFLTIATDTAAAHGVAAKTKIS